MGFARVVTRNGAVYTLVCIEEIIVTPERAPAFGIREVYLAMPLLDGADPIDLSAVHCVGDAQELWKTDEIPRDRLRVFIAMQPGFALSSTVKDEICKAYLDVVRLAALNRPAGMSIAASFMREMTRR